MSILTEKIEIDGTLQPIPYFIYTRLKIRHFREYFSYTIPAGYGYLLRRFVFQNAEIIQYVDRGPVYNPYSRFEFFLNSYFQSRQVEPIPGRLFSSPGDYGKSYWAPDAVDLNGYGIVFDAAPKKYEKILNWYYPHADTLRLDYTGVSSYLVEQFNLHNIPEGFADICFQGYLVPEGVTKIWRK